MVKGTKNLRHYVVLFNISMYFLSLKIGNLANGEYNLGHEMGLAWLARIR